MQEQQIALKARIVGYGIGLVVVVGMILWRVVLH